MHRIRIVLILGVMFQSLAIAAPERIIEPDQYILCKNRGIVRTIRVESTEIGGCQAKYTKAGVDKIIGRGRSAQSCTKILNNVKQNLINASWSCREVSNAKITAETSSSNE